MTFDEFMQAIERERPEIWRADKVNVSTDSLRQQLRRAYGAGYDQADKMHQRSRVLSPFDALFECRNSNHQ